MISLASDGAQAIGGFFFFLSFPDDSNTELRIAHQIQPLHFTDEKNEGPERYCDPPINIRPKPQNRTMIL